MELFALYFNLLLFYMELSFCILNYMGIVERKSENRVIPTISWFGIG